MQVLIIIALAIIGLPLGIFALFAIPPQQELHTTPLFDELKNK